MSEKIDDTYTNHSVKLSKASVETINWAKKIWEYEGDDADNAAVNHLIRVARGRLGALEKYNSSPKAKKAAPKAKPAKPAKAKPSKAKPAAKAKK